MTTLCFLSLIRMACQIEWSDDEGACEAVMNEEMEWSDEEEFMDAIAGEFVEDVWANEEEWDELTLDALFRQDADGRREQEAVEPEELTDFG